MNLEASYSRLPENMRAAISPEPAKKPELIAWNHTLAAELGLEALADDPATVARIFSGGPLPENLQPVTLAYAGHQFGMFVPQLGDGRAVLLGEAVDCTGRRRDVQLKGSGRTPYSRGGDGRSWLGPVIREYLVSEAMYHLGVPTTRALAAVATGEQVYRDSVLPGAVFTRVASSHLRVGSFEFLAARGQHEALKALANYAIDRHDPEARDADDPYAVFFEAVADRQAVLVARWMAAGFIHGVMNTDNTSIAGETLDYGPCAFMDEFSHDKVFSSIDHTGRYAYGNQPLIAQWNLARLAECLLQVRDSRDAFEETLAGFPERYDTAWRTLMHAKLGLSNATPADNNLVDEWLFYLENHRLDYTLSFRELAARLEASDEPRFGAFENRWRQRVLKDGTAPSVIAAAMNAVNPLFIPRNHRIEQAIREAVEGDYTRFHELGSVLQAPFIEQPAFAHYTKPPAPGERVAQTFCGT